MNVLLRARHWQLFLLMIIVPEIGNLLTSLSVLAFVGGGAWLAWIWAIATILQSKVPADVEMKILKFKILFFVLVTYLPLGFYYASNPKVDIFDGSTKSMIFLSLHLFAMFCALYCMYFAAKTLRTGELHRKVIINDFSTEFFMVWFFPIGIWMIQPRVNKLVNQENKSALNN